MTLNAFREIVASVVAASLCVLSGAQTHDLFMNSVDPESDARVVAQMRKHMDEVRAEKKRPTVGLVLSGGGAKGAAEIGALEFMEDLDLPIDLVVGTSIGGLVGCMYSLGYSPMFMDSLFRSIDWGVMLTDFVPDSYKTYQDKIYREKYAFVYPFESLKTVMPTGYAYGLNVHNLYSRLTVGYQDPMSFMDMPVPYVCVASDMVSCYAKNWTSGSLNTAIRSTMSIPGLFDPVRTDGMVLVDGGMRNNFPVDIAKAMGCDYVIGIDLSDADLGYSEVNNLEDIVMQAITMLGKESFEHNITMPDILIKPRLTEYNMLSFEEDKISVMIARGYDAAHAKEGELLALKEKMNGSGFELNHPKAKDILKEKVLIGGVEFYGLSDFESRLLMRRYGLRVGTYVGSEEIDDVVRKVYATGVFKSVTYTLAGTEAPYRLVFNCVRGPKNQVGLSVRYDTMEAVALGINVGLGVRKLAGAKLDIDGELGLNPSLGTRFTLDLPFLPSIHADASIRKENGYLTSSGLSTDNIGYWGHKEQAYFSIDRMKKTDIKVGAGYEYYNITSWLSSDSSSREGSMSSVSAEKDLVFFFANLRHNTFDNNYFPSSGINYGLSWTEYANTGVVAADYRRLLPLGSKLCLIVGASTRNIVARQSPTMAPSGNMALPFYNLIGGTITGRYIDHQIPFMAMNYVYAAGDYAAVVDLNLRATFSDRLYATLYGGCIKDANNFKDQISLVSSHSVWGVAGELAFNTKLGPVRGNIHWNSLESRVGAYLSIGYDF